VRGDAIGAAVFAAGGYGNQLLFHWSQRRLRAQRGVPHPKEFERGGGLRHHGTQVREETPCLDDLAQRLLCVLGGSLFGVNREVHVAGSCARR
jgi:hypothetical protein